MEITKNKSKKKKKSNTEQDIGTVGTTAMLADKNLQKSCAQQAWYERFEPNRIQIELKYINIICFI